MKQQPDRVEGLLGSAVFGFGIVAFVLVVGVLAVASCCHACFQYCPR